MREPLGCYNCFKGEFKQLTHINGITNVEINGQIDVNLNTTHRAIIGFILLNKIHFHFFEQEFFALVNSSKSTFQSRTK